MRWDEQRVENEDGPPREEGGCRRRRPGTVVRTFDAPEGRRASTSTRSVAESPCLNRVPGRALLGFKLDDQSLPGGATSSPACQTYCFARRTHTYLDFDAGRDFEREIVVKVNTPEVLRAQLARPSWQRELVALGTNTDPYQWAESRYRFMPEIIAALEAARTPISVLTKSPLVLRDIDLYAEMAKAAGVSVNLSIPTLDERRGGRPSPTRRARAPARGGRRAEGARDRIGVLIAPLMPGINDSPEQVEPLVQMAREAGADFLGGVALHLRDEVRDASSAGCGEAAGSCCPGTSASMPTGAPT